jgi:hypothetical protein
MGVVQDKMKGCKSLNRLYFIGVFARSDWVKSETVFAPDFKADRERKNARRLLITG